MVVDYSQFESDAGVSSCRRRPRPALCARSPRRSWPRCSAGSATSTSPRRRCRRRSSRRSQALAPRRRPRPSGRLAARRRPPQRARPPAARTSASRARIGGRLSGGADVERADLGAGQSRPRGGDDRLALLFACCHPALAPEARLALTLRAVVGLTTPRSRARSWSARRRSRSGSCAPSARSSRPGSRSRCPTDDELPSRLDDVLTVVSLMYNEAYVSTTGVTQDRDLGADAVWLADVIATSLPRQAEAWGLAALLTLQHARSAARFDDDGNLVLLRMQDRSRWDRDAIATAESCSSGPPCCGSPVGCRLQAAIAACHATAPSVGRHRLAPDRHVVRPAAQRRPLAGAAAQPRGRAGRSSAGPSRHWPKSRRRDGASGYHLFHATRAELLRERRARRPRRERPMREALARDRQRRRASAAADPAAPVAR